MQCYCTPMYLALSVYFLQIENEIFILGLSIIVELQKVFQFNVI